MGAVLARAFSLVSTFGASVITFGAAVVSPQPAEEEPRVGEYRTDYSSLDAEDLAQESGCEELIRASRVISVNHGL